MGQTECMFFLMKDEKSFKIYNETLEKVSNIMKNNFHSKLIYNKKYVKAEEKSYDKKIITKECSQLTMIIGS